MAKKDKVYQEYPDLKSTCEALRSRYHEFLGYIDFDKIYFAEKLSTKADWAPSVELSGTSASWIKQRATDEFDNKLYCLSVYHDDWDSLDQNYADWLLFEQLLRIGPMNDGKIRPYDTCGFGFMIQQVGPYWRDSGNLPSLRSGMIVPIPLPPASFDGGSGGDFEDDDV